MDQWNAEHPDVKVVYRSVPWSGWYETYVTAIASGSAAGHLDRCRLPGRAVLRLRGDPPVDDRRDQSGDDPFAPGAIDAVTYDGHFVALPWTIDIRAIYYRKDILAAKGIQPPTTWDEFRAAAKAVTGEGVYGLVSAGDAGGMHWHPTAMINNGGGLFDAEGKPSLTGERSMEALDFLSGLVADGSVNPSSAGYASDDARGAFCRGEAAFILDSPGLPNPSAAMRGTRSASCRRSRVRHGDTGTIFWVNNIMVYKQTEHPDEAMAFLKWWSENQLPLWTEGHAGSLPARRAFQEDEYFQSAPNRPSPSSTTCPWPSRCRHRRAARSPSSTRSKATAS